MHTLLITATVTPNPILGGAVEVDGTCTAAPVPVEVEVITFTG